MFSLKNATLVMLTLATAVLIAVPAAAEDAGEGVSDSGSSRPSRDSAAWDVNTGFVPGLALILVVPDEGAMGAGAQIHARYGIPAGPVILAPGAQMGGYVVQRHFVGNLMGTFRLTVPLGPFAPYGQAGLGPGLITNPGEAGLAWMGGGGLMIHFGRVLAFGADVSYQAITGTDYKTLTIGPSIIIGG